MFCLEPEVTLSLLQSTSNGPSHSRNVDCNQRNCNLNLLWRKGIQCALDHANSSKQQIKKARLCDGMSISAIPLLLQHYCRKGHFTKLGSMQS